MLSFFIKNQLERQFKEARKAAAMTHREKTKTELQIRKLKKQLEEQVTLKICIWKKRTYKVICIYAQMYNMYINRVQYS